MISHNENLFARLPPVRWIETWAWCSGLCTSCMYMAGLGITSPSMYSKWFVDLRSRARLVPCAVNHDFYFLAWDILCSPDLNVSNQAHITTGLDGRGRHPHTYSIAASSRGEPGVCDPWSGGGWLCFVDHGSGLMSSGLSFLTSENGKSSASNMFLVITLITEVSW